MELKPLAKSIVKKYWPLVVLLAIVAMAFWFRTFPARFGELQALDPLYMYRISEDVLQNNFLLPETDIFRGYPYGGHPFLQDPPMPFYLPTVMYAVFTTFGMNMVFFQFALIFPAIMGALAVFVMYFLGKELFNDRKAGLFAAFFLATVPAFITRTSAGFYEKEPIAGLFLILSIYFFVRAYRKNSLPAGIIAGISLALVALTWGGVQFLLGLFSAFALIMLLLNRCPPRLVKAYIPTIILGVGLTQFYPYHLTLTMGTVSFSVAVVIFMAIRFAVERFSLLKEDQLPYVTPAVIVLGIVVVMSASMFIDPVNNMIQNLINSLLVLKGTAGQTVAEQLPGGWGDITGNMGLGMTSADSVVPQLQPVSGFFSPWGFTLIGMALLAYALYRKRKFILLVPLIWIIVAIYGVFGMIRLLFLLGPAAALVSGYFFSELIRYSKKLKVMRGDKRIGWLLLFTGAVFLIALLMSLSNTMITVMLALVTIPMLVYGYLIKSSRIEPGNLNLLVVPIAVIIALTFIVNASAGYGHSRGIGPSICFPQSDDYKCITYNEDGTYQLAQEQPWYQAMTYLAEETPENSSILSWWDFGYWFQTRGQRPSVSDGGGVGPRDTIARWYVDKPENWDNHQDSLLKKHNVTHILMDYTLPGKYGAISKIAYEGQAVYGYMEFPRQPNQIYPRDNMTINEFLAGPYALWLPLNDAGNLVDSPMLLQAQGGQFTGKVYINNICTPNGIVRPFEKEPAIQGCIAITPYRVYFVPPEIENTIFNSLMVMDGYGLPVKKVFDNGMISIYDVLDSVPQA